MKLKDGIFWSDGVEFTADDVVYTVETQIAHPGMGWSAPFTVNVDRVEAPDPHTVVFHLKAPNSRFHTLFTVRWNAAWIMPKHVFEKVADPLGFKNNPPVSLSAYVLQSYDKAGNWAIWKLRDDWQRTSIGMGSRSRRRSNMSSIAMPAIPMLASSSSSTTISTSSTTSRRRACSPSPARPGQAWPRGSRAFPFAHPDPTLPSVSSITRSSRSTMPMSAGRWH